MLPNGLWIQAFSHCVPFPPGEVSRPSSLESHSKHPAEAALCAKATLQPCSVLGSWGGRGTQSTILPGLASWVLEPSGKH